MRKILQHKTVANIIRRLPLHQQLDESQTSIIRLTPIWQDWANQPASHQSLHNKKLSDDCYQTTQLISVQNGKLVFACSNAANASQIKHQHQDLLNTLHKHGYSDIQQIVIRIQTAIQCNQTFKTDTDTATENVYTSKRSLIAIEKCQSQVKSERLANSLAKLAKTLKNREH